MSASTIEAALHEAGAKLKSAGVDFPRMEARLLLAHAMGATAEDIVAERMVPDAGALSRFNAALARRCAHEPIAYILGRREFWSLSFAVDESVLIPRPESEVLVEEALRRFSKKNASLDVLDLGIGSGCLLLSFLSERPRAKGVGVDASPAAAATAARNAKALGLEPRTHIFASDWSALAGTFDVIFANPPYIRSGDLAGLAADIRDYEPAAALDGGPDGLSAYRSIAAVLPRLLARKGHAFVELGQGQAEPVAGIFAAEGLDVEGLVNDLSYIPRCLVASRGT